MHIFDRSGVAALSDLQSGEWEVLYHLLEKEQSEFLTVEGGLRSPQYKWPRDPLHTWSRVWEYPYVYYHLQKWRDAKRAAAPLRVVDLGSGVTFFPFSVARLGYHVTCVDTDPIISSDIPRAARVLDQSPGQVDCLPCDESHLPFGDEEVDAVYCISVLEHVPEFEHAIADVARILKPGGQFLLTIDLDLCGYLRIDVDSYHALRRCLSRHFVLAEPEISVHPGDLLEMATSPFSDMSYSAWKNAVFHVKQQVLKPLLGRKPFRQRRNLAIWGAVVRKCR